MKAGGQAGGFMGRKMMRKVETGVPMGPHRTWERNRKTIGTTGQKL